MRARRPGSVSDVLTVSGRAWASRLPPEVSAIDPC